MTKELLSIQDRIDKRENNIDLEEVIAKGHEVAQKIKNNIDLVNEYFFVDTNNVSFGNKKQKGFNVATTILSYALARNTILYGEPGWGKTTIGSLASAIGSGLPPNLFRKIMVSGHPDQTEEKMMARPDFGKLMDKKEVVIFQDTLYFPSIILDEFNRLPEGKQNMWLEAIDNSSFSYLNATLQNGKKAFFATANYADGGNNDILPPALDRFHFSLELNNPGSLWLNEVANRSHNVEEFLNREELAKNLLDVRPDQKDNYYYDDLDEVKEYRKDLEALGLKIITKEDYQLFRQAVRYLPFDDEDSDSGSTAAEQFLQHVVSELTYTPTFGMKRSSDPIDSQSGHAKDMASTKIKNSASPRAINQSWQELAKAFALLHGEDKLKKEYLTGVFPYVFGHRLQYTDDFRSDHQTDDRTVSLDHHLAGIIQKNVMKSFMNYKDTYSLMQNVINYFDYDLRDAQEKKEYDAQKTQRVAFLKEHQESLEAVFSNKVYDVGLLNEMKSVFDEQGLTKKVRKALTSLSENGRKKATANP